MPDFPTVLHYVGADDDRSGIVSVVRALRDENMFACILGVNAGCMQHRSPALPVREFQPLKTEKIDIVNFWRARKVAEMAQQWLAEDATRIFHGHTRAGMLVALWLHFRGERRFVVSAHCYGRQRWFYRWAARRLQTRLYWLSPAMRRHYGIISDGWTQCIPECASMRPEAPRPVADDGLVHIAGVGLLVPWKGWHLVLDALTQLPQSARARLRFRHIGVTGATAESRNYAEGLFARTVAARLVGCVEWLGERPSSASLLAESDCLVVASRDEPFSVAMLEALQAGVPVIAADSGGATDIIAPPENGALFKTGSARDLARVLRALAETDLLQEMRVDRRAVARFSAPAVAARWVEVYTKLLAGA